MSIISQIISEITAIIPILLSNPMCFMAQIRIQITCLGNADLQMEVISFCHEINFSHIELLKRQEVALIPKGNRKQMTTSSRPLYK